jgi:hypothetical protein
MMTCNKLYESFDCDCFVDKNFSENTIGVFAPRVNNKTPVREEIAVSSKENPRFETNCRAFPEVSPAKAVSLNKTEVKIEKILTLKWLQAVCASPKLSEIFCTYKLKQSLCPVGPPKAEQPIHQLF